MWTWLHTTDIIIFISEFSNGDVDRCITQAYFRYLINYSGSFKFCVFAQNWITRIPRNVFLQVIMKKGRYP